MANVPPKTDAELAGTVVVTGTRGSAVSYTLNDTSLYDWWDSWYEPSGEVGSGRDTPVAIDVPVLPLPPAESAPVTVVVAAPAPRPVPTITVGSAPSMTEAELPFVVVSGAKPKPAPKPRPRPRRSKPAPKPSRRPRPITRPGPRIPIEVPALVRVALGRLAGVLALVPALFETLKAIDRDSQDKVYERLFGAPGDDRDRSRDPIADAARLRADASGDRTAPIPEVVVTAQRPLETVTITGRAPTPVPTPALVPRDLAGPRLDYGLEPLPISESVPAPAPRPNPAPRPINAPLPAPLPFAPPDALPVSPPAPRPTPGGPRPGIPASPLAPPSLVGNVIPLPERQPVPQPALDKCRCNEKKPKKKKKRDGRSICYAGSYVEKTKGLNKHRLRRVDCKTGKTLLDAPTLLPDPPRKKTPRKKYPKPDPTTGNLPYPHL